MAAGHSLYLAETKTSTDPVHVLSSPHCIRGVVARGRAVFAGAGPLVEPAAGPVALWQLADHARLLAVACLALALCGGGWHCPGWAEPGVGGLGADLAKVGIFAAKTALVLLALLWLCWSLPGLGLRRGQSLAWKVLLPLSLVNLAAVTWIATLL